MFVFKTVTQIEKQNVMSITFCATDVSAREHGTVGFHSFLSEEVASYFCLLACTCS